MTQKLKLSPDTIRILQNFSSINSKSILVRPGNKLSTINENKSQMAVATVEENFETEFAIHDLTKFLSAVSVFGEPELEIGDKQIVISEGNRKLNYTLSDKRVVLSIGDESIQKFDAMVDKGEVEFDLTDEVLKSVDKARSILKLQELVVEGDGGTLLIKAADVSNSSADTYQVALGDTEESFKAVFRAENLKFLPKDYHVKYAKKGLARFSSENINYYVVTEARKA